MNTQLIHVLLADDDIEDRLLFKEALKDLPISTSFETVYDGVFLMDYLRENQDHLPDVLFLDLNMPRKSGFECLAEIQQDATLSQIPTIIYTSNRPPDGCEHDEINMMFKLDGHYYIQKPADFNELQQVILGALAIVSLKKKAEEVV